MTIRPLVAASFVVLSLTSASPASERRSDSAARFFPAHTYFYAELNPRSGIRGFQGLKLAKLLEHPALRGLAIQALRSIPRDSDPLAMLARYPFDKAIGDSIALGLVGFVARIRATETSPARTIRFPEDGALDPQLFGGRMSFNSEAMLAIKVTDKQLFMKTVMQVMTDMVYRGEAPKLESETTDGIEVGVWPIPGVGKLYSSFVGDWFLAAQSSQALTDAVHRHKTRTASLMTRSDFRRFEAHRGSKPSAGFIHIGIDSAIELFSPMIPKSQRDEIAMWGGFDYCGLQIGMGFHDGAIVEWFHLALAENAKGIFLNLARLIPSTAVIERSTERGTVHAASLTLDWAAVYKTSAFLASLCGLDMDSFERDIKNGSGFDLREDLLGALGNSMGGIFVMPKHGVIPELSVVIKVRNRAKMEKLLSALVAGLNASGVKTRQFTVPGGGPKGTYVSLGKAIPIKPAFALAGDSLVISTMPLTLKSTLTPSKTSGMTVADLLPDATKPSQTPMFSCFVDPAPLTMDVYADLLKIMDSIDALLPIQATDLPSPEFLSACVSKLGIEFAIDPYFMSVDLHSPTGLMLPLLIAGAAAIQQENRSSIH